MSTMDADELALKMAGFCCHELGEMDAEAAVFLLPYARALIEAEEALADATDYVVSEWTGVGGKDLTRGDIPRFRAALASLRSLLEKP